ncbi:putative RING finger protein 10 [Iris pallida]|uniref:RING finger protein 10 n=1 Tax=Iris pallida TaxID=29817 RepID=A0AAX6DQM3_IRIPA|nr:putative RING finger protein 10 [Iris pallida]
MLCSAPSLLLSSDSLCPDSETSSYGDTSFVSQDEYHCFAIVIRTLVLQKILAFGTQNTDILLAR